MSVIFEGVDGIGKTTKALKLLNEDFHQLKIVHYIHNWVKPKKEIDSRSEVTKEILLLTNPIQLILDRSFIISEFVYASVLNRKSYLTFEDVKNLIDMINKYEHVIHLMYYKDIKVLKYKNEDSKLPHDDLNSFYIDLLMNRLSINHLIVELVEDRRN
jgi:hypothetical protein